MVAQNSSLEPADKTTRGTEIILHIAEDSLEFLRRSKINCLLNKYNKFIFQLNLEPKQKHFLSQKMLQKIMLMNG
jgi:HSP90 family molecular chaperone